MWFGSVALSEISCDEVLAEIEHYLHGELDHDRAGVLGDHLGECGTCLDHSEFQRRLKEIVRAKCRMETPSHLLFRVREAIRLERLDQGDR
jgi:anti-sigma factor (TIGR02949 family)